MIINLPLITIIILLIFEFLINHSDIPYFKDKPIIIEKDKQDKKSKKSKKVEKFEINSLNGISETGSIPNKKSFDILEKKSESNINENLDYKLDSSSDIISDSSIISEISNEINSEINDEVKDESNNEVNEESKFKKVNNNEIIVFNNPDPWCKVNIGDNYTKYHIYLNVFDENKFIEWKKLIGSLDYDVENKELIIETNQEYEALALINLIISNMNNSIDFNEILNNKLISISIEKAKSHSLVCNKLKELIRENNSPINNLKENIIKNFDVNNNNNFENQINIIEPVNIAPQVEQFTSFEPTPYGGSEFAFL